VKTKEDLIHLHAAFSSDTAADLFMEATGSAEMNTVRFFRPLGGKITVLVICTVSPPVIAAIESMFPQAEVPTQEDWSTLSVEVLALRAVVLGGVVCDFAREETNRSMAALLSTADPYSVEQLSAMIGK
jgi:hypothetical protein